MQTAQSSPRPIEIICCGGTAITLPVALPRVNATIATISAPQLMSSGAVASLRRAGGFLGSPAMGITVVCSPSTNARPLPPPGCACTSSDSSSQSIAIVFVATSPPPSLRSLPPREQRRYIPEAQPRSAPPRKSPSTLPSHESASPSRRSNAIRSFCVVRPRRHTKPIDLLHRAHAHGTPKTDRGIAHAARIDAQPARLSSIVTLRTTAPFAPTHRAIPL